jgi:uncharacterized protein (TIRG00374 family)
MSLETAGARSWMNRAVRSGLLALVSVGLVYVLIARAGLTWPALAHSIAGFGSWALLCILVLTGANLAFGTLKWLLVIRAFAPEQGLLPRFSDALLTSALGELLGQTMPVQAGIALARSMASRFGIGRSLRGNLGTTIYEQLFDLLVLCSAAIVGLLGQMTHLGAVGWLFLAFLSVSALALISFRLPTLLKLCTRWLGRILRVDKQGDIFGLQEAAIRSSRISFSVVTQLITLSILRYVVNLMRVVVVLGALSMWVYAIPAMIGFPLIQIVGVVPITPGNLGVIEWTWSAVLASAGATMAAAAVFALTSRIVNFAAVAILVLSLIGVHLLQQVTIPRRSQN